MEWNEYKTKVAGSRQAIVFPFFERALTGKEGIGIDIGCGDGDLTKHIAKYINVHMVGIDISSAHIKEARTTQSAKVHFIEGDLEKNIVPTIGIRFDFAVSNCCLSQVTDEGVYQLLIDLHSSLRTDGDIVALVPCLSWARDQYASVSNVSNGITALPRYGGRQFFRLPEWYTSALYKCGFDDIRHEVILVPDDSRLEARYRSRVGQPLFDVFIARRIQHPPNLQALQKAFDVAHENRKLEIGLFWQRSLFFWGFVASALVGYATAYEKNDVLTIALALFGFVCSIVWAAGNRGSKYWQEYWERKVNFYQHYATGNIFYDRTPKTPRVWENYAARRISVSKLTMALSDYMVVLWLVLCLLAIVPLYYDVPAWLFKYCALTFLLLTLVYCVAFLYHCESED